MAPKKLIDPSCIKHSFIPSLISSKTLSYESNQPYKNKKDHGLYVGTATQKN
jgi:hypothetical protein